MQAQVRSQARQCEICGGQSGTGTGFALSTSVFPCVYYSTKALFSFIHPSLILYDLSSCTVIK
jgi:hypothetical protein